MSGQESFCFSTLPHHPAGRRQTCRTRLSVDKSIEATTPHGPATWLASCVLGVARRFECSEVARTAYGACASDGRSVGAPTERAPNLRGREGVKRSYGVCDCGRTHIAVERKHTEWRDHHTNLMCCKRVSSFITDATDAKQRPLPHRELHEAGGAAWRLLLCCLQLVSNTSTARKDYTGESFSGWP